jgi:hypothetical protein
MAKLVLVELTGLGVVRVEEASFVTRSMNRFPVSISPLFRIHT